MFTNNSKSSVILSSVNLFSKISAIFSTMILSHNLDLSLYGTYSQTNLLVITATSLCALGLVDSTNYFFNKSSDLTLQKKYINTVMGLQVVTGLTAAVVILLFSDMITAYFKNPLLRGYLILLAFRPMFVNLNIGMQYLHISIGKHMSAAIRTGTMSILRILVVIITSFLCKNITVLLIAYLLFEVFFSVVFYLIFGKEVFWILPWKIQPELIKEILRYSIPMGIYVITNALNRDIDKILIGRWYPTEQYAIYANCATILPFGIIATSFMTILIPVMTRYFGQKNYDSATALFRNYLQIGYYSSFVFTVPFILLSKEAILILYGDKYLTGQSIFILYILVSTIQFSNMAFVLSASGKTYTLMAISFFSIPMNLLMNIAGYKLFGMPGPAIATVCVTLFTTCILLHYSAKSLHCNLRTLFCLTDIGTLVLKMSLMAGASIILLRFLRMLYLPSLVIFVIAGGLYMIGLLALSRKKIWEILHSLN